MKHFLHFSVSLIILLSYAPRSTADSFWLQDFETISNPKGDFFDTNPNFAPVDLLDNPLKSGINTSNKVAGVKILSSSGIIKINFQSGITPQTIYPTDPTGQEGLYYDRLRFKYYSGGNPDRYCEFEPNGTATSPKTLTPVSGAGWVYVEFILINKNYNNFQIRVNRNAEGASAGNLSVGEYIYVDDFELYNSETGPTTSVKAPTQNIDFQFVQVGKNTFNYFSFIENPSEVKIDLISIDGRSSRLFNQKTSGVLSLPVQVDNKGIYFIRMTVNNKLKKTIKFINH